MSEAVGFLGLGALGSPIAANLLSARHKLVVWNRTPAKADALVAQGAKRAERPADAVSPGGGVISLLWDDASVECVVAGDGFLDRLGEGGVHVSMSTLSPEGSQAIAALHARSGSQFVEAPIFGRPEAAAARHLWIPCAGPREAKARVWPLFEAIGAQHVFDLGEDIGAATTAKLVGNFLIIAAGAALTEGLSLVRQQGFDAQATLDMLTQTLFPSPIYQNYGRMIAAGNAPPAGQSAIPQKDLGLFAQTARAASSPAPLSAFLLDLVRSRA